MELVQLKAADFENAIDFMDMVFSRAHAPTRFTEILPILYQPTDEDMQHNFAVKENGKIRAIVGMFPAEIKVGEDALHLEGIGGVSAHPNDKGKGWMKMLMNHCIDQMKATDTDLSFLTGLRQRYQYFGYDKAGTLLEYSINQTNLRHTEKKQPEILPLHFVPIQPEDQTVLEACKKLYDRQPFCFTRSLEKFYLYLLSVYTKPWAALYPNGEVAGYLVTTQKQDRITEIFADNDLVFTSMIYRWFAEREITDTTVLLTVWQESFAHILSGIAEDFQMTNNGNWRIYNWEHVIGTLLKLKGTRYSLADGTARIGITGYGTLQICVSNGVVECHRADVTPDVEWDSLTATRALLGHISTEYVAEIPAVIQNQILSWFPLPLSWLVQNYV